MAKKTIIPNDAHPNVNFLSRKLVELLFRSVETGQFIPVSLILYLFYASWKLEATQLAKVMDGCLEQGWFCWTGWGVWVFTSIAAVVSYNAQQRKIEYLRTQVGTNKK